MGNRHVSATNKTFDRQTNKQTNTVTSSSPMTEPPYTLLCSGQVPTQQQTIREMRPMKKSSETMEPTTGPTLQRNH